MSLTYKKLYSISVTHSQYHKTILWPYEWLALSICHLLVQASNSPLCSPALDQLCMLDTEHIVSTVKCKFSSKKCYSVDCCFVLGWWVQCHVLCQRWCCACWSWWNTLSYEACCCTGDIQLGSINYIFKKFVQLLLKIALQYCSVILMIFV